MGTYRNVTTLEGIEITSRKGALDRIIFDAKWAEPRSEIEACRQCGVVGATLHCHGPTSVKINDTPWGGKPVGIRLKKERYKCQECEKTFTSEHPGICDDHNVTWRLAHLVREKGLKNPQIEALAGRYGLSVGTVWNLLRPRIEELNNHDPSSPMRILGIDEIHMPSGGPHTVFTDLWEGTVLEFLESNEKSEIRSTLEDIVPVPQLRSDVHVPEEYGTWQDWGVVAVAMDMETRYRDVVSDIIPRADVIVDRYHLVDKAREAVSKVRKDATSEKDEGRRGENRAKAKPDPDDLDDSHVTEWKQKKDVFDKRWESLSSGEQLRLKQDLRQLPDLKAAYFTLNEFKKILDLTSAEEADKALTAWERALPESIQKPFRKITKPLSNWREQILNYFRFYFKYTNAGTEALNGSIRQIITEGRHHRNFKVLKAKVLERLGPEVLSYKERQGGEAVLRGKPESDRR